MTRAKADSAISAVSSVEAESTRINSTSKGSVSRGARESIRAGRRGASFLAITHTDSLGISAPFPWLSYRDYILLYVCLLYTSDAADDLTRVDLGGRCIIQIT